MVMPAALVILTEDAEDLPAYGGTSVPQLIPIANRPLLAHALSSFRAAGITDLVLVVSEATAEDVRVLVGDGSGWRMRSRYIEMLEPFGVGAAVLAARERIGEVPLLVHDGGSLLGASLPRLLRSFARRPLDALLLVNGPVDASGAAAEAAWGAASDSAGGDDLDIDGALAASILAPSVAAQLARLQPSWRGEVELAEALRRTVAAGGRVERAGVHGWQLAWTPDELLQANRFVLDRLARQPVRRRESGVDGRVRIDPSARLESSIVRGPAVIGPGARIVDAYVGPYTTLGARVVIEGSEVEDSIVYDGAAITNLGRRLEASIVGRESSLSRDFSRPPALRMRVAERAEIALA
jgi:glucose-1-phosphate thymidylyltransferase